MGKRRQGPGHNEANKQNRESRSRSVMLDGSREGHFRYDVEEVLVEAGLEPEEWRPFLQTVWAQGSRNGIDEAKNWVNEQVTEGKVPEATGSRVKQLIQRYRTVR
jgi:hypothetical protein